MCDLMAERGITAAAIRFFKKAIGNHEVPEKITLDGSQASHQAVAELKAEVVLPAQTLVRTKDLKIGSACLLPKNGARTLSNN